jgi:hypothetical protein
MERLLFMRLQVQGCSAEVLVNDIPVGRAFAPQGVLCLPVHEYLMEGANEITLVIQPDQPGARPASPQLQVADGVVGATVRLLLPRVGRIGSDTEARTVAEVTWAAEDGDVYSAPVVVARSVALPIKFPRWRWLDAPPIDDVAAHRPVVSAFLHNVASDLMRGEVDTLVNVSRLRLDELALAYQQPVTELVSRFKSRLALLYATKSLRLVVPNTDELVLRKCANGRLLECLAPGGAPALSTVPGKDGVSSAWPARLAVINGQCHILR